MPSKRFLLCIPAIPVLMVFLFIVLAIWQDWPFWQKAFRSDESSISWLSSAQLWAIAYLYLVLIQDRKISVLLGGWLFFSFVLLAIDEQFLFHEQWKYECIEWFDACQNTLITEAPIIIIAILGGVSASLFYGECKNQLAKGLLGLSVLVGLTAIYIDLLPVPHLLATLEEGFEVIAEALWLSCLLALKK